MRFPIQNRRTRTTGDESPDAQRSIRRRASACCPSGNGHRTSRRGFTITEIVVTMILLGTVIALIVPLAKRAIDERERSHLRRAGLIEISNVLERLVADPSVWLPPGDERTVPLPEEFASRFDEPQLKIASVSLDGPVAGRRFDAALSWRAPNGRRTAPLRLSAFAFPDQSSGTVNTAQSESPGGDGGSP